MKNLSEIKEVVNQMYWSYNHNGNASTSKLDAGVNYLNGCSFTEQEIEDAIDNHGSIYLNNEVSEIAQEIASNLGAEKLRSEGLYYEMYDENGSFQLN
jgi:hypothetical protein